jgi:hypothetical protein
MATTTDGDIVEIVMDVVHVSAPDGEFERVLVQGVFPRGRSADHPAPPAGANRNVVQVFFGRQMNAIFAFLIETGLTASEPGS